MAHSVRVQIYTMQTVEEALAVATLGVDHIGVTPATLGLPGEVALARAAEICAAVKGAATSVIEQLPEDPLHEHYERMLTSGIKPTLAKLTVARRVAAIVLAMWKHQEVYDPQKHVVVTDKT